MRLPLGSDEMLVAYLDNELSEAQRNVLENRLLEDDVLAQRLALLERSNLPFKKAFEPLLQMAPIERLQQTLNPSTHQTPAVSRRHLIAAAVSFLALGVMGDRVIIYLTQPEDNWRELVAQYMALYTPETLAETPSNQAMDAQLLTASEQLGLVLSSSSLSLPGAVLKTREYWLMTTSKLRKLPGLMKYTAQWRYVLQKIQAAGCKKRTNNGSA